LFTQKNRSNATALKPILVEGKEKAISAYAVHSLKKK
jgi:hypothetical protein